MNKVAPRLPEPCPPGHASKTQEKGGKTSFVMHLRHIEVFNDLPGDDVKRLMLAIGAYVENGTAPDFSDNPGLQMAFRFVRADLDRDRAKWEEAKARMSEAGKLGAERRWGKAAQNTL